MNILIEARDFTHKNCEVRRLRRAESPQAKWYLVSAFVLYVLGNVFTFAYFYPRNAIMFEGSLNNVDALKTTWSQWNTMNWFRSLILVAGLICTFLAMRKIYNFK